MAEEVEKLKEALFKKALGYEYEEKEVILDRSGRSTGKVRVTKKQAPPDMKAWDRVAKMMRDGEW